MTILDLPKRSHRYQPTGQTWLISMHCSHKTFHFLSVSDNFIRYCIVITLRKPHEIILWRIFEKPKILAKSQRRHGKDIFFDICLSRLKDATQKTSFLRGFWDVLKTWLRSDWDLWETSHAGGGLTVCSSAESALDVYVKLIGFLHDDGIVF